MQHLKITVYISINASECCAEGITMPVSHMCAPSALTLLWNTLFVLYFCQIKYGKCNTECQVFSSKFKMMKKGQRKNQKKRLYRGAPLALQQRKLWHKARLTSMRFECIMWLFCWKTFRIQTGSFGGHAIKTANTKYNIQNSL